VIEARGRILLEDHETVVIKDKDGRYIFRHGRDSERSFFLDPYSEVVKFYWSSGLTKDKRGLILTHIDSRPKYMWYDFDVRTQDNVELTVGITFFWQIVDVERMIRTTDDTTGDVCAHARSKIIQAVSRTTLEQFLAQFNEIIAGAIFQEGDPFYAERGVKLLSVEVRYIQCKDPNTQRILQEIIQETTNRLNRLQKQESENEVRIRQVEGEIVAEQERLRLLEIQRENSRIEAITDGEAEAQRVLAFIEGLGQSVGTQEKIALFQLLRKGDILNVLSKGTAQLYFTPADVDLSIDTHLTSQNGKK
jgi:regulator of protease activity HflC (stomatin/prohibitin superfamily)